MTIDERLEALTQSVELLAAMHRDSERSAAERERSTAERERSAAERERAAAARERTAAERETRLDRRLAEIMEAINTLGRIAGLHQDRLDDHERRLENLE